MRIAIVGSGVSGLVAASRLHAEHDITVFEAGDYVGGHVNTVDVEVEGERHAIDTGFIVFNDWTYPNFCRLLNELNVPSDPTSMSFSVRCDRSGVEYNGTNLNGVFAQRTNLLRPSFHRMLRDILRFNRESPAVLQSPHDETQTVGEFLAAGGYSREFADRYLLPMGSAIWSCPAETFAAFPIRFIVEFYRNHGLLNLRDRPVWRVIRGGSREYVTALAAPFRDRIRLNSPVTSLRRSESGVLLFRKGGAIESFDEVILACHSDQALRILGKYATPLEREVLGSIPYEPNTAVLHTDAAVLPRRRRAWASWNYRIPAGATGKASVTYHMNRLQGLRSKHQFCVTLNDAGAIDERRVLGTFQYSHPVFTTARRRAQQRHHELIRANRTSYCGAYWGNGFHEDGVNSALAVCRRFETTAPAPATRDAVYA